jgi:hypothetical protein
MKTLKTLAIIGLFLIPTFKSAARDFKYGFVSGLVVSNANILSKIDRYKDYRAFYPLYGFNINGFIEYKISERWGIAAEPGFIRKGGVVRFGINHYTSEINMKLHYLQLPVLANYNITEKLFASAGPEFAYMINNKDNLPLPGTGFSKFKDNAFEVSGLIGLNYSISKKVGFGLRYNHGLTKISILQWTDGYGPVIGESKVYNQYFQLIIRFLV